jgi:alpha-galactosidase
VPAHGVAMLRLSGTDQVTGDDLGGTATSDPALVRFDDTHAVSLVRGADGALWTNTRAGETWNRTWTPLGGSILGQPAAYGSAGGRAQTGAPGSSGRVYLFALAPCAAWTATSTRRCCNAYPATPAQVS